MTTKKSEALTLSDRLSRLTYTRACKLLGPNGKRLIARGAAIEIDDLKQDVYLAGDLFRLRLPGVNGRRPVVTWATCRWSA